MFNVDVKFLLMLTLFVNSSRINIIIYIIYFLLCSNYLLKTLEVVGGRFAKLELSLGSKPTGYSTLIVDMLCIHNHTLMYYIICIIIILRIIYNVLYIFSIFYYNAIYLYII